MACAPDLRHFVYIKPGEQRPQAQAPERALITSDSGASPGVSGAAQLGERPPAALRWCAINADKKGKKMWGKKMKRSAARTIFCPASFSLSVLCGGLAAAAPVGWKSSP